MCFEALVDGDAAERPVGELIREEMGSALTDGGIAATAVLAVLLIEHTGVTLATGVALVTLVLGVALHQVVLVAGVGLVRLRGSSPEPAPETA